MSQPHRTSASSPQGGRRGRRRWVAAALARNAGAHPGDPGGADAGGGRARAKRDEQLRTAGALLLGGGTAGYAVGRWIVARWLDQLQRCCLRLRRPPGRCRDSPPRRRPSVPSPPSAPSAPAFAPSPGPQSSAPDHAAARRSRRPRALARARQLGPDHVALAGRRQPRRALACARQLGPAHVATLRAVPRRDPPRVPARARRARVRRQPQRAEAPSVRRSVPPTLDAGACQVFSGSAT